MKKHLFFLSTLAFGTAAAQDGNPSDDIALAGQWVSKEQVEEKLDHVLESYQEAVFSDEFRAHLQLQSTWQKQLTFALLSRYYDGPGTGLAEGPAGYIFETQLGAAIDAAPTELAPRVLMLAHCHESQLLGIDECFTRHGNALLHYHPENAASYLVQAQRALADGEVAQASQWMEQAGQQSSIDFGAWAIVKVLFEVFGETQPNSEDPLTLTDVARFELAQGSLAHLSTMPHIALNYPCQQVSDEPLLSGCLAAANAMKLPGTLVMAHRIALAIEQNVYRVRGNDAALRRLALERQSLPEKNERAEDIRWQMIQTGKVRSLIDAWVSFGELDTTMALTPNATDDDAIPEPGLRRVWTNAKDARLRCLPFNFPAGAPACVTQDMMVAESLRLSSLMDQVVASEEFTQRLASDPGVDAQLMLLQRIYHAQRKRSPDALPPIPEIVARFPSHPVANRLAAQWCADDALCLHDTAQRIITHEPTDALGYLLLATAHLAANEVDQAIVALDRLPIANTFRGGFGVLSATTVSALQRHVGPPPQPDPLGVWPIGSGVIGIGYAAALALPAVNLVRYCANADFPSGEACLQAGHAMTLPGASVLETLVGLQIVADSLEQSGPSQALEDVIDQIAQLERRRDELMAMYDRLTFDPQFSQGYLDILGSSGEMAALRWLEAQPPLFED